jgi:hypothetical protein
MELDSSKIDNDGFEQEGGIDAAESLFYASDNAELRITHCLFSQGPPRARYEPPSDLDPLSARDALGVFVCACVVYVLHAWYDKAVLDLPRASAMARRR